MKDHEPNSILEKLHSETALMHWSDLQRFFAQGKVLCVAESLNLVRTAALFADDNAKDLAPLIDAESVCAPSNDQARTWFDQNIELWTVVVAPYILVQEAKDLSTLES